MRSAVARIPSESFYGGLLRSAVAYEWQAAGSVERMSATLLAPEPGQQLIIVPGDTPARGHVAWTEAAWVARVARAWSEGSGARIASAARTALARPTEPQLIVSCFYRSQVAAVRAALANT